MPRVFSVLLPSILDWFRSRVSMQMERIALRHHVAVYQQRIARPKRQPADRLLWVWLSRLWPGWQQGLEFVQPRTIISWQNKRFRRARCSIGCGSWVVLSPIQSTESEVQGTAASSSRCTQQSPGAPNTCCDATSRRLYTPSAPLYNGGIEAARTTEGTRHAWRRLPCSNIIDIGCEPPLYAIRQPDHARF